VRVLLDENLPHDLIFELDGLDVVTVQGLGWAGIQNGELLRRAARHVAAFVTEERAVRPIYYEPRVLRGRVSHRRHV